MKRETAIALNRRLLHHVHHNSTDQCDGEWHESTDTFMCPTRFAKEREALFLDTPQPVAFSAELPTPNSYLALDVMDIPVLLTRDEAGVLHAFLNTCRHRGARVAEGAGQRSTLVCGFHGWAYRSDGSLAGRPCEEAFSTPPAECSLQALPVSEHLGVVVLGLRASVSQAAVDDALTGLASELGELDLRHYKVVERRNMPVAANWKLVTELSLESYHFAALHRNSVATVLSSNAVVDTFGQHTRWAFPLKTIERLANLDQSEWPDAVEGSCTYTLYPGIMLIVNASGAQMIRAEPGDTPGQCRVSYTGVCAPDVNLESARTAYAFGGDVFAGEDLPVAEQCQQSLATSTSDLIYGANEPLLQYWHALWRKAVDKQR